MLLLSKAVHRWVINIDIFKCFSPPSCIYFFDVSIASMVFYIIILLAFLNRKLIGVCLIYLFPRFDFKFFFLHSYVLCLFTGEFESIF